MSFSLSFGLMKNLISSYMDKFKQKEREMQTQSKDLDFKRFAYDLLVLRRELMGSISQTMLEMLKKQVNRCGYCCLLNVLIH